MREIINKLVDTLTSPTKMALYAVIGTVCYTFIKGTMEEMQFVAIATGVTGFYFGQHFPGGGGGASTTSITSTSITPAPPTPEPVPITPATPQI